MAMGCSWCNLYSLTVYVSIRKHTSVSIRQHTSACVSIQNLCEWAAVTWVQPLLSTIAFKRLSRAIVLLKCGVGAADMS
jgi:hypothetical protein